MRDSSESGRLMEVWKVWYIPLKDERILNVRKNGDVYTFHATEETCSYYIGSAEYSIGVDREYEVVIRDGVIVSGKQIY